MNKSGKYVSNFSGELAYKFFVPAALPPEIEIDEEMVSFLFSLGCYSGESITVISKRKSGLIVAIKDARYNIDTELAKSIIV